MAPLSRTPATKEPSSRIITLSKKSRTGKRSQTAGLISSLFFSAFVLGIGVLGVHFDIWGVGFCWRFEARVSLRLREPLQQVGGVALRLAVFENHQTRYANHADANHQGPIHRQKEQVSVR